MRSASEDGWRGNADTVAGNCRGRAGITLQSSGAMDFGWGDAEQIDNVLWQLCLRSTASFERGRWFSGLRAQVGGGICDRRDSGRLSLKPGGPQSSDVVHETRG